MRNSDRPDVGRGGLLELLDRYPVCFGLLGANVVLFLFALSRAGGGFAVPPEVLYHLGGNVYPEVRAEPWRLLTSAFLHADVIHILFNSFALLAVGRVLEVQLGSARLWVIYVLAAVGGSVCSAGWQAVSDRAAVSVGASGGAFGLIFLGWVYASRVPERLGSFAAGLRSWLFTIAIFSLLFFRDLDHAAHAGGAAVGALFGRQLDTRPGRDLHPAWAFLAHGLALLALASFAAVVLRLRGRA